MGVSKENIQKIHRLADQMASCHSKQRDIYDRRSLVLDLLILLGSALVAVFTFAPSQTIDAINPTRANSTVLIGSLASIVFLLSLIQLKVGWKSRASDHASAVKSFSSVKRDLGQLLENYDDRSVTEIEVAKIAYYTAGENSFPIPERKFLKLKAHHLKKVRISRILDRRPHVDIRFLQLRLWWRDTWSNKL